MRTFRQIHKPSEYRIVTGPREGLSISCNLLSDLQVENSLKVFSHYCLFVVSQGRGSYEDHAHGRFELSRGAIVQHLPRLYHTVRRDPGLPWTEVSFTLSPELYELLLASGFSFPSLPVLRLPCWESLEKQLLEQFDRFSGNGVYESGLAAFLGIVSRINWELGPSSPVEQLKELLSSQSQKVRSIPRLCEDLGYNYHSLRRKFRQQTGMSPGEFLIVQRIEKAKYLLRERQYSVKEIAVKLGYPDQFSFSRQFKKKTGVSPGSYSISTESGD